MDLYDAFGRPIQASRLDAGQDQEHSDTAEESTDDKQPRPGTRPPIKVIVESSDTDLKQHKAEYRYSYALQRKAVQVQWCLFVATLAAFGAAAYYAWIAKGQLEAMNQTLKETHVQNVAQQRATLIFEVYKSYFVPNKFAVTIKNTGHMRATILNYTVWYNQRIGGDTFTRDRTVTPTETESIGPGGIYNLEISTPRMPKFIPNKGAWEIMVTLAVIYDDGFGDKEGVKGCFSYSPRTNQWDQTCAWFSSIDLSTDTPQKHAEQ